MKIGHTISLQTELVLAILRVPAKKPRSDGMTEPGLCIITFQGITFPGDRFGAATLVRPKAGYDQTTAAADRRCSRMTFILD